MAALAVSSRGYIGMLSRSGHTLAHKRLGDLHRRWEQANRLLAPAIEILPQLLIVPVVLFVVGLLDNLISNTIPLSRDFAPVFAAGVASSVFAVSVGGYTMWTVLHGCLFADLSPFQSTISIFFAKHSRQGIRVARQHIHRLWVYCILPFDHLVHLCFGRRYTRKPDRTGLPTFLNLHNGEADLMSSTSYRSSTTIEDHEYEAFHVILQQTHEDDVLDQAVAAFASLIEQRHLHKGSIQSPLRAAPYEIYSLSYMLSDEASIRSNITAAGIIAESIRPWQSEFVLHHPEVMFLRFAHDMSST